MQKRLTISAAGSTSSSGTGAAASRSRSSPRSVHRRSETVTNLQHAARGNARDKYREFARLVNEVEDRYVTIRSLFKLKTAELDGRSPVPLE